MMVCRRNGKCIAHLARCISDKDYWADVVTPLPADLTGNGAMLRADEQRKYFLRQRGEKSKSANANAMNGSSVSES
jgi:hypothetical protein